MGSGSRNYTMQRNYEFDTHDENGISDGRTIEEWMDDIRKDWSPSKLKAKYIYLIFHKDDTDDNGMLKGVHVHGYANFTETISQSVAIERTGCSSSKNCEEVRSKSNALRYMLHITEKAIKEEKYIYGEDKIEILLPDGEDKEKYRKKFHSMIKKSEEEEEIKDDKKLLKKIITDIANGVYGHDISIKSVNAIGDVVSGDIETYSVEQRVLMNDDARRLMFTNSSAKRAIESAISTLKSCDILYNKDVEICKKNDLKKLGIKRRKSS